MYIQGRRVYLTFLGVGGEEEGKVRVQVFGSTKERNQRERVAFSFFYI